MTRDREPRRDARSSDDVTAGDSSTPRVATRSSRRAHWLGALALIALTTFSAVVRIRTALADPNFDRVHAEGMLKSDPGLLYYFTERILESGGRAPSDFRADPRVEYPLTTDIPAMFPVGQEFVVAWSYRWLGDAMPLHVFCVWIMGAFAALCACGVYGLALELTGRVRWALFAAALYTLLPANYRTIGFILVGEDFSVPWFVLHLWLLARAARVRTSSAIVLAAIPLGIALATWHASSFFFTLEAACVVAWFLRSGENPFDAPRAAIFAAVLVLVGALVPVLSNTLFVLSLPMQWMAGMLAASWLWRGRDLGRVRRALIACAAAAAALLAAFGVSKLVHGGWTEYSHVFGLLWQKVIHFGRLPADPRELPFEVRLMWQGPFDTLDLGWGIEQIGFAALFIAPAAAWTWRAWSERTARTSKSERVLTGSEFDPRAPARERTTQRSELEARTFESERVSTRSKLDGAQDSRVLPFESHDASFLTSRRRDTSLVASLLVLSLPIAWLIERTILLPGILLPVIGACWLARMTRPVRAVALALALLAIQALCFDAFIREHRISWYRPPQRQQEIAALVASVREIVPEGEAIASDFMNSTAILAHTRHPIVLQPKYEFRRSRERAEKFLRAFFEGTPQSLRRLVLDEFHCRYLLIDRFTLGYLSRYTAGIPRTTSELAPGSAAAVFLGQEQNVLEHVPGYRLLYRSPPEIVQSDGSPTDFFRLYELEP
jgi:hypothetical protein